MTDYSDTKSTDEMACLTAKPKQTNPAASAEQTPLSYWEYIALEPLLALANPVTDYPDERVFIIYHQMSELLFSLMKDTLTQLCHAPKLTLETHIDGINRLIRYAKILTQSFEIMIDGLSREQFLAFRRKLAPASGFQSVQFREIELMSTQVVNLMRPAPQAIDKGDLADGYAKLYFQQYMQTEKGSGLALREFNAHYQKHLIGVMQTYFEHNLLSRYHQCTLTQQSLLMPLYRGFDAWINLKWRHQHYRAAVKYLSPGQAVATGGSDWQKALSVSEQRIQFFPTLWRKEELDQWGSRTLLAQLDLLGHWFDTAL